MNTYQCTKCGRTSQVVNLNDSCPFCVPSNTFREELHKLLKREYMRGQIDRSNKKYSLESLEKRHTKYLEDNPSVNDDVETLVHESQRRLVEKLVGEIEENKVSSLDLSDNDKLKFTIAYNQASDDIIALINQTLK